MHFICIENNIYSLFSKTTSRNLLMSSSIELEIENEEDI